MEPHELPENVLELKRRRGSGEPWVSAKRVAEHLGISERTVQRLAAEGMPKLRVGGSVRYRLSEVEAWATEMQS